MSGRLRLLAGKRDRFKPIDIPRSLAYGVWDFEQTGRITLNSSEIAAFSDPITGASFAQGTGADQPALNASGFNGRPCSTYDGTDYLRNTTAVATLGWPTSGAFEIWAAFEYTGSDIVQSFIFAYPSATNTGVSISAATTGARFRVGTGSANVLIDVPMSAGRHIIRAVSTGTTIRLDVDGVAGTPVACVAAFSGTARNTIGAGAASTPANFFIGKINFLGFYRPLPTLYSGGLYRNLNIRKG